MAIAEVRTLQTVLVSDGRALFEGFVEADPVVVEALSVADPDTAAHGLLALGARAATFVATSATVEALEGRLGTMTAAVESAVDGTLEELTLATTSLLNEEDGELAKLLRSFAAQMAEMLDPARRDSAASALTTAVRAVMEKVLEAHDRDVRHLIDPEAEGSPLGRVVGLVRENNTALVDEVRRLGDVLTTDKARAEGLDQSGLKGAPYEEALLHAVGELTTVIGDATEHVGQETGSAGNRKGDIVVHVNPVDMAGRTGCYALEAKTGKGGLRAALSELDQVMANRDAAAALAVYASADVAPCRVPFQHYDNRAIVVFDRADLDDRALRLGCLWARWVVRRQLSDSTDGPALDRMSAAIERARHALGRVTAIRRSHSTATNAIRDAKRQVDDLIAEVDAALHDLTDGLGGK
jgi:hypothetical protein